jgi:peptide/nickel transport system ATP-binding protein
VPLSTASPEYITVMYSGEAVETGTVAEVFDQMRHPYTRGLFNSIPLPGADKNARPLVPIPGQLPLPHQRPQGCWFGPRCGYFEAPICGHGKPAMDTVDSGTGHSARCRRWREIDWDAARPHRKPAASAPLGPVVLEVDRLKKYYEIADSSMFAFLKGGKPRTVKANEQLDFNAREAQTVAIVGESGCGKSTFAKVMMGLETATEGEIRLNGKDISRTRVQQRGGDTVGYMQMVFQNPFDTLNPSHSVGGQIARAVKKFGVEKDKRKIKQRVLELLDIVKLPHEFARRRPRQLSGGQKQRIGIARAFAGSPTLVVADEPVSALDVSVQAAVTELLMDIQRKSRTTMLFISHDLSVVRYLADRIVVMYLGRIMEQGATEEVFSPPYHPYTEALLSAVPIADTRVEKRKVVLTGEIPSPLNPPKGCVFSTRCPYVIKGTCDRIEPPAQQFAKGHDIACHLPREQLLAMQPIITVRPNRGQSGGGPSGGGEAIIETPAVLVGAPAEPAITVRTMAPAPAKTINGAHVKLTLEERARHALTELSGSDAEQAKAALARLAEV